MHKILQKVIGIEEISDSNKQVSYSINFFNPLRLILFILMFILFFAGALSPIFGIFFLLLVFIFVITGIISTVIWLSNLYSLGKNKDYSKIKLDSQGLGKGKLKFSK